MSIKPSKFDPDQYYKIEDGVRNKMGEEVLYFLKTLLVYIIISVVITGIMYTSLYFFLGYYESINTLFTISGIILLISLLYRVFGYKAGISTYAGAQYLRAWTNKGNDALDDFKSLKSFLSTGRIMNFLLFYSAVTWIGILFLFKLYS